MNLWDWNYITFPFALGTIFCTHLFHYIWVNRIINKISSINIRTVLYLSCVSI